MWFEDGSKVLKIYTKKGDAGQTFLFGGGPYPKDSERIAAYGEVDELNSVVGCVVTELKEKDLQEILHRVQKELFVVGAELATLKPSVEMQAGFIQERHVANLEHEIDQWETELTPLTKFILPGGSKPSAWLHLARTVSRRAERSLVHLSHDLTVRPELLCYMNRLSDWFFVLARLINHRSKVQDILWEGML